MPHHTLLTRYPCLAQTVPSVEDAIRALIDCFSAGGKLLTCGNGGSAADSDHIVGELMKSFLLRRRPTEEELSALTAQGENGVWLAERLERGLPAVSLCAHSALMTAVANDTAADTIFAQQIMALGRPGDVLLTLSTSGNSRNCVLAATAAKARGMTVIALTGMGGGRLGQIADITVAVPEKETYKVQELHLPVYHALCSAVEEHFFGE